jgi:hypothetical protein
MAGIIENGVVAVKFVAPISIVSNQPAFATDSISLKRHTASQNAQRWEITTNLMPSNGDADFLVHSVVNGHDTVFQIEMPQVFRRARATTATSAVVSETVAAGAKVVQTSTNGDIAKGEFVQFENHSKVYLLRVAAFPGDTTLSISPELRSAVPEGTRVLFGKDVRMNVTYELDTALGITYVDGIMSDPGSVKLIEAL